MDSANQGNTDTPAENTMEVEGTMDKTTIREILKDAHHETQRILTNTMKHFQDAGYGILSILVATTAMIDNLDINGSAYQQNE
eukprot:7213618-Pyramimonas_sp.AAC.1